MKRPRLVLELKFLGWHLVLIVRSGDGNRGLHPGSHGWEERLTSAREASTTTASFKAQRAHRPGVRRRMRASLRESVAT